jgi:1-acyl-sn-glycerol-3-phosphate acyltransferase
MAVAIFQTGRELYPKLMKMGNKPISEWKKPHTIIISTLSNIILFLLPVNDEWIQEIDQDQVVFVGNQQVWGLGTLTMIAAIYKKSNVWVRVVAEPMHFNIPIWKHIIELFGAVDGSNETAFKELVQNGFPILIYPGGSKESMKKSTDDLYRIDFEHDCLQQVVEIVNTTSKF